MRNSDRQTASFWGHLGLTILRDQKSFGQDDNVKSTDGLLSAAQAAGDTPKEAPTATMGTGADQIMRGAEKMRGSPPTNLSGLKFLAKERCRQGSAPFARTGIFQRGRRCVAR